MEDEIADNIDDLQEDIKEKASEGNEEKKKDSFLTKIALTTAIIAALAAITSYIAGDKADEAMLDQIKASDQWSYYQAKSIKINDLKSKTEILQALGKGISEKDSEKIKQYEEDLTDIKKDATEKEENSHKQLKQRKILATAITFFQISIAIGAVGAITRKRPMWYLSLGLATIGLAELFLHGFFK